ncbi:patatin-like phospholipase family protein [Brumimicrobium aurantiacum]|uniref:patatin-like phospholipase family protein n=1 Tax=Brumimicrobium aurantiacum TaxID=1737063 RepID=UPI0014038F50|nr:patatin-like phospholipase family protein [Brumimicrobium aurantiacum]
MKHKILLFLFVFGVFCLNNVRAQKVGVVLSGGGATGLAHIGVLKALEEANIPIDYISGTSAGALIGALYASGFSPNEIEAYILSDNFNKMTLSGDSNEEQFLLREKSIDPSMLNINFATDSIFVKSLPTNFLDPSNLDYETFRLIGNAGAAVGKDFDSLFIPFRCVAADIYNKESVIFRDGDLNSAVRASMTYPFYINPIRIDGKLYFDGGLYNNFPADVLYNEFPVDYIIGSNVSLNASPPTEDDIISQITTMFVQKTSFELPCDNGIIIEPETSINTFDFEHAQEAIETGYLAAKANLDSICVHLNDKKATGDIHERRTEFRKKITPIKVSSIDVSSFSGTDVSFVRNNFMKDTLEEVLTLEEIKERYYRSYSAHQVKYIYPTIHLKSDSTYHLSLDVTKQKPLTLSVGGHFSSRPVNTAYIGLSYWDLSDGAVGLHGEAYFGKFYGSSKLKIDYDLPTLRPIRISPYFVLNRWDYYRSSSTFFEDVNPSFLIQNEMYYGLNLGLSKTRNGKTSLDLRAFENNDEYYQTLNYSENDTADATSFMGQSAALNFEYNTLNRKQWASSGSLLKMNLRYVQGKEKSISGTTPGLDYDVRKQHRWINLSLEARKFYEISPYFKIGVYGKGVLNSQSLFSNYTATVLNMTEFSPLPDSKPLFLSEYRAPQFIGGGVNFVFNYSKYFEFRIDPYFFQPFRQIVRLDEENDFGYSDLFEEGLPMVGGSIIFQSPIGPLRLSTNYFPKQDKPFVTQLSFGYMIFNDRSIR